MLAMQKKKKKRSVIQHKVLGSELTSAALESPTLAEQNRRQILKGRAFIGLLKGSRERGAAQSGHLGNRGAEGWKMDARMAEPLAPNSPDNPPHKRERYFLLYIPHCAFSFTNQIKTNKMHKYRILSQLLHLHVSVYMTILSVLIEYISVVMCRVHYISIYSIMMSKQRIEL
jgi:hypothetical protein